MKGRLAPLLFIVSAFSLSCSFDYGSLSDEAPDSVPDIAMSDVEYIRVRDGKPVVRLQADSVERYEKERRMVVSGARFAQYAGDGSQGAVGGASSAVVDLESGDVSLDGAVSLSVPQEDLVIETDKLTWKNDDRVLLGSPDAPVLVKKSDGSFLSGRGFTADARSKSWTLTGSVFGTMVEEDKSAPEEPPESPSTAESGSAESGTEDFR